MNPSQDLCNRAFDRHQIVFAEGAPMESLFTGIEALKEVSAEARREIFEIMPDLMRLSAETLPDPARPLIQNGRIARKLAARLCCTNPVRDSSRESSMVAGWHEQTDTPDLQDQELAGL